MNAFTTTDVTFNAGDDVVYLGSVNNHGSAYYRSRNARTPDRTYAQAVQNVGVNHDELQYDYANHTLNDIPNQDSNLHKAVHEPSPGPPMNNVNTPANCTRIHSMITRGVARENAVSERNDAEEDFYFWENDDANVNMNDQDVDLHRDNANDDDLRWMEEFSVPNSPPFIPDVADNDDFEHEIIMNNIQVEPALPIQPMLFDQQAPPLFLPPPAIDVIGDIVEPRTSAERRELVSRFRDEVYREEVEMMMREEGINNIDMNIHDPNMVILMDTLRNYNVATDNTPFMTKDNIIRHDWSRDGSCVYTLRFGRKNAELRRGSAEELETRFLGVKRALWEYWAHRPAVHVHHIRRYLLEFGAFGYYRTIMWHHLPEKEWLALWRLRRVSSRD
ncbi:hypothetical protein QFC19_001556 [Naganishia cerealis]|uniref:Uncharacterized protein n=1 Tax=Naganishia cerealis TaxID=610337 RepID=A0ACC2WH71_9TREE|nr:hypothetical protein QFC19_001556 [Naganishia cerealis]